MANAGDAAVLDQDGGLVQQRVRQIAAEELADIADEKSAQMLNSILTTFKCERVLDSNLIEAPRTNKPIVALFHFMDFLPLSSRRKALYIFWKRIVRATEPAVKMRDDTHN